MRHICKYITGIFLGATLCGTTVNAAEIINIDAVMYTNAETVIYAEADLSGEIVGISFLIIKDILSRIAVYK